MKINNVSIDNWIPPGAPFWKNVKENPDEPTIEATIKTTLTWREYADLLNKDERGNHVVTAVVRR